MQKRILVVDDDQMNLMRTQIILGEDYDVVLADSGIRALHILRDQKIDLVLLDIDMPDGLGRGGGCGRRAPAGGGGLSEKALPAAGAHQAGSAGVR